MDISGRILLQTLITITDSKRKARSLHILGVWLFLYFVRLPARLLRIH